MRHNRTPLPDQAVGNVLIIFVRLPVPGQVKTRLGKRIGHEAACEFHRCFVEWTLSRTPSPVPGVWRRWICFTPRSALNAIRTWLPDYPVDHHLPQAPGDLGVRMMAATGAAFHARASKVVVVGTDCPAINQDLIDQAFAELDDHDVAIGPAQDGGYYLLGLRKLSHQIFQQIPWSTDQVLSATRARIAELGLSYFELPMQHDIDRQEDLIQLSEEFLERYPALRGHTQFKTEPKAP